MPNPDMAKPDASKAKPKPIAFCEIDREWNEERARLEERRHRILETSRCCNEDEAIARLSPRRREEIKKLDEQIGSFSGGDVYATVWEAYGLAGTPHQRVPSQRDDAPKPELPAEELGFAVTVHRLRMQGWTDASAQGFRETLECEKAKFSSQQSCYENVAQELINECGKTGGCVEISLLESATQQLIDEPTMSAEQAIMTVRDRRRHGNKRELLASDGLVRTETFTLDPAGIRAAAVVSLHHHFAEAGGLSAVGHLVEHAEAGITDLDVRTVERLESYQRRLDRRWPSDERATALYERLFDDPFDPQWRRFLRAAHEFTTGLTADDVSYGGVSLVRGESVRGLARPIATLLVERAPVATQMIAKSLERQIISARRILGDPSVQLLHHAHDWQQLVHELCPELTGQDIAWHADVGECTAILLAWLATNAPALEGRQQPLIDIQEIAAGDTSANVLLEPTAADAAECWECLYALLDLDEVEESVPQHAEEREPTDVEAAQRRTMRAPEYAAPARVRLTPPMFQSRPGAARR
jgi:hypothetical protein